MFGHGLKKIPLDMIHFFVTNTLIQDHSQLNEILVQITLWDQMLMLIGQLVAIVQFPVAQTIIKIGYIVRYNSR